MRRTFPQIKQFRQFIFSWWKENRRDLPWRRTHDPYRILISEVMLQQTQVSRVLPKYAEFIEAWPRVQSLAQASSADVLRLWKGMGYNRRALYLKNAAEIVVCEYKGKFPKNEKLLAQLPGLGTYTARAILVFAYGQEVAAVDTNVRKIITHFFFDDTPQKESVIQVTADALVPSGKSWEWHQALMDYGALELPKFKRPEGSRRTSVPFRESNRFFRGRIVDALRERTMKEPEFIEAFVQMYDRSEDFVRPILNGLEKDGLIARKNGKISLPE